MAQDATALLPTIRSETTMTNNTTEPMSDEELADYKEQAERYQWSHPRRAAILRLVAEVERLKAENAELLEDAIDEFCQGCGVSEKTADGRPMYDHGCLSTYEYMAAKLIKAGIIQQDQLARPL